jgi:glycine dehydrogenase
LILADGLKRNGYQLVHNSFFDTITVQANRSDVEPMALSKHINLNFIDEQHVSISINETTNEEDIAELISVFPDKTQADENTLSLDEFGMANTLRRPYDFLTQEVFNRYHSETELMRYIKRLERKDLALNHSMIALGSCTMKLNAAAEMLPLSDPNWAGLHPLVPLDQAQGYQEMLSALENQLTEITGFAATSLQPNSGAQGEYAGLMVIRAYHHSRGNQHRDICLIPSSAHGTNPASAVMAGMKVVVTKASNDGNIDVEDLREKALQYKDNLAALMITYPSTHGVYESAIKEITSIIHECGGQVYMDGANMNAQVALTHPGAIGADVCHLNLHKTFAIPHGGGGPGVGPICVASQLAPFLPSNPVIPTGGTEAITAISGAPWGSALACLISYGYICMLGESGLRKATEIAILNANYIKERLKGVYETLYTGEQGRAAHEMILDCRPFKQFGIEVTDIAKRLMDYGYHAPTVSFPVAGTVMVEPTESESKAELDRFCDAMIAIRREIDMVSAEQGDNLLKNAPHTLAMVTAEEWTMPYSRQEAAFPLPYLRDNKFWPAVRRVDDAYGDRNLICTCTPIEAYA